MPISPLVDYLNLVLHVHLISQARNVLARCAVPRNWSHPEGEPSRPADVQGEKTALPIKTLGEAAKVER
jgi:hypothetical protein